MSSILVTGNIAKLTFDFEWFEHNYRSAIACILQVWIGRRLWNKQDKMSALILRNAWLFIPPRDKPQKLMKDMAIAALPTFCQELADKLPVKQLRPIFHSVDWTSYDPDVRQGLLLFMQSVTSFDVSFKPVYLERIGLEEAIIKGLPHFLQAAELVIAERQRSDGDKKLVQRQGELDSYIQQLRLEGYTVTGPSK